MPMRHIYTHSQVYLGVVQKAFDVHESDYCALGGQLRGVKQSANEAVDLAVLRVS